jgi:hypothetical protein
LKAKALCFLEGFRYPDQTLRSAQAGHCAG